MPDVTKHTRAGQYVASVVTSLPGMGFAFAKEGVNVAVGTGGRLLDSFATGHTLDGTSDALDEQTAGVHAMIRYLNNCSALPTHTSVNRSKRQEEYRDAQTRNDDMSKFIASQNLLWDVNGKLEEEWLQKILKEEEESRQKEKNKALQTQNAIQANTNEVEDANLNAMGGRALLFIAGFGILDILEIAGHVCEAFNLPNFEDGVKAVLQDDRVMNFMAKVNETFHLGDFAKELSKIPVLSDFNQFVIDVAKSEAVSPFTAISGEVLVSDPANFVLKAALLLVRFNEEVKLSIEATKKIKDGDAKLEKLRPELMKMGEERIEKSARSIIEVETKANLKRIDFKVLQNIRSNPNQPIDNKFQNDLQDLNLFYKDDHGNQAKVSAFDLLNNKDGKYDDPKYLKIMDCQNKHDLEKLTEKVRENSDKLNPDHQKSREDLLLKSIEKLDLQEIKNVLNGLKGGAKQIGDAIKGDSNKRDVVNQIMNLKRGEADEAIIGLAGADTNVKARIAKIKIEAERTKARSAPPTPGDIVGSSCEPVVAMQLQGGLEVNASTPGRG